MKTIYISKSGDDKTGDGSKEKPFLTPHRGLTASREEEKPCALFLGNGTYFLREPLALDPQDSRLHIRGEGQTVLTGAKPLSGLIWRPHKNGIWCAAIKSAPFDRMFADGKEQTLCRYPNRVPGKVPLENSAAPQEIKERSKRYKDPAGGRIRAIHEAGWGGNSYLIKGKDSASSCGLELQWVGDNNRGSKYGKAMVVENVYEELDAPGEWFYEKGEGRLYWYPPEGTDPNQTAVAISMNTELMALKGLSGQRPVKGVTLENLTFTHTGQTLFPGRQNSKPYEPLLRGDWCVVRSGAVFFENAEGCAVTGCKFLSLGGNGLFLSGYEKGHKITGNLFEELGASGIQIVGESRAVRQPSFWEHSHYPSHPAHQAFVEEPEAAGPLGEDYPRDITIAQNHIHGIGLLEKQSAGINLSVSSRIRITHNTIHNSARSLINVNDGTFGGHEIAWNDLYDAQRETEDHGPFNSWGRDRFWSVPEYNASGKWGEKLRFYEKNGQTFDITKLDAYQTVHLHHNRFHHPAGTTHSWGIDLDDGSTNYEIDHNLVLGIGIKLREGFDRRVHHNLLVDGQLQIHVPYTGCRDEIYHNLVLHCAPVGTAGCNKSRYLKAEIKMYDNFAFAGGKKIKIPPYFPKFQIFQVKEAGLEEGLPAEWAEFFTLEYGQKGCACRAPEYSPTYGKSEKSKARWVNGAQCVSMTEALRSSTAAADCGGLYVKTVLPFTAAAKLGLRERDVIREADGKNARFNSLSLKGTTSVVVWRQNHLVTLKK